MKKKVDGLELEIINLNADHEKFAKREARKQKKLEKEIKDMHTKVIKPMLLEIKVKDELIARLKAENDMNVSDLK